MLQAAEAHYRRQAKAAAAAVAAAWRTWDRMGVDDLDASWRALGGRLVATVAAVQILAARDADPYVSAVLAEQKMRAPAEGRVNPTALAGVAGDGRDLATLLFEPVIDVKTAIGSGLRPADAMASARSTLGLMVATAVQDASRAAVSAAMTSRPKVTGYVRMLNTPSCSRCVILAGRWYRWNTGFERHPRCDCRHIPASEDVAGDLRTDPLLAIQSGQVTGLSKADTSAILDDGADVFQVINAHRGMSTAQVFGHRVKTTSEGTTKRGLAFRVLSNRGTTRSADEFATRATRSGAQLRQIHRTRARAPRLMPESIYKIATDREDAIRLLQRNGFIL